MIQKMESKKSDIDSKEEDTTAPTKSWFFNPIVFTTISCCSIICYTGQLSYLGASLSMVEKRFQMRSAQSSLLFTINDVIGLCSVLFITHFGQKGNRPRIIGTLYLLYGIGVLIAALPHFLYELPLSLRPTVLTGLNSSFGEGIRGDNVEYSMCNTDQGNINATCDTEENNQSGALIHEAWWLFLGYALAGLVSATGPLTITFLDDNQNRKNTPVYVGVIFSSWAIGTVFGFFLANFCLRLPVNFPNAGPESTVMDPMDPRFLGAWWLGMVICGIFLILCCLPMFLFPRQLGEKRREPEAESLEDEHTIHWKVTGLAAFSDLLQAMKRTLTNMAVMALILATCFGTIYFIGFRTFGTKYMATQFDKPTSQASLLIGIIIIPCAVCGNIMSGVIIKKLRLNIRGLAMMLLLLTAMSCLLTPLFFFAGCQQNPKAGLTVPYGDYNDTFPESRYLPDLSSACNDACNCPNAYSPVCGSDGVTYSSPCHAGCSEREVISFDGSDGQNQTTFSDCSCVEPIGNPSELQFATQGECQRDCSIFFHVVLGVIFSAFEGLSTTPLVMLVVRYVTDSDRSLVLGFTNLMLKLLGYIPGPVIWGAIIDRTCVMFQESCGKTGNCIVYDTDKFRNVYFGTSFTVKLVEMLCLAAGLVAILHGLRKDKTYKAVPDEDVADEKKEDVRGVDDINTQV